jgi:hypothetical protein
MKIIHFANVLEVQDLESGKMAETTGGAAPIDPTTGRAILATELVAGSIPGFGFPYVTPITFSVVAIARAKGDL